MEARKAAAKQVLQPPSAGAGLTLDRLSPGPHLAPAETSSMSQPGGRLHNKKAGIRAAVILIGLLHRSRKAKEREREREDDEGWVKFVASWCLKPAACWVDNVQLRDAQTVCSVKLGRQRKLQIVVSC